MKPLALSVGDPSGVGPELAAAVWRGRAENAVPPFYLLADPALVAARARLVGIDLPIRECAPAEAPAAFANALPIVPLSRRMGDTPGVSSVANAAGVIEAIDRAVDAVRDGEAGAVVTAPIAKKTLYDAGFRFPGHTEFIAELTSDVPFGGTRGPVMMLTAKDLRACLVTIHVPIDQLPELVTGERVARVARVVHESMKRDFGIVAPRLAMAALNPHAGEGGALGLQEIEVLRPAAEALRAEGLDITDPLPADTLFHEEARARYDAVVCLYHDQALIPVKTLDFWGGVNATLGLPIVRTSPDHGTGFDIAGKGIARADSFIAAVRLASEMASARAGR